MKIKTLIKYILYFFINKFVLPSNEINPRSLLLIRLDAIGDYILFRNFIEILTKSDIYNDHRITLVGNVAWKELSEKFDLKFIQSYIWIDKKRFSKNMIYRYKKLREIASEGYEVILSPRYSKEFFFEDAIVKLVNAKEKIGSEGDLSNIKPFQKRITDKYYTRLIPAKPEVMFEFYRNKEFFESLLGDKIKIKKPSISLPPKQNTLYYLPMRYAVLFIGGGADFRKWDVEKFAEIGRYLRRKYALEIVVCGSKKEVNDLCRFREYFPINFIDLVGKTLLIDLLYVLDSADLVISNETVVPHIVVAIEKPHVIVISNGNHFGRFTPYPKKITNRYHVVYPPKIEKDLKNYKQMYNQYGYGSNLDISEISVKKLVDKIDNIITNIN